MISEIMLQLLLASLSTAISSQFLSILCEIELVFTSSCENNFGRCEPWRNLGHKVTTYVISRKRSHGQTVTKFKTFTYQQINFTVENYVRGTNITFVCSYLRLFFISAKLRTKKTLLVYSTLVVFDSNAEAKIKVTLLKCSE